MVDAQIAYFTIDCIALSLALTDGQKAAAMLTNPDLNVFLIGVIENMSWFTHFYKLIDNGIMIQSGKLISQQY